MGGFGSGRWMLHSKATTVEECRQLDINRWTQEGLLSPNVHRTGVCTLSGSRRQGVISLAWEVKTLSDSGWLRLTYTLPGTGEMIRDFVELTTTRPRFGGVRWWFLCPRATLLERCRGRVGKLFLVPRGRNFGCRHCHRLTYKSSQESHKVNFMTRLGQFLDKVEADRSRS